MTSGFFSASAIADPLEEPGFDDGAGTASLAGVSKSLVDFDALGESENLLVSVPGVGGDAKSLYELSVIRGIFQGNRRSDMQQNIIAIDHISAG